MIFQPGDIILSGKYRVEELAGKGAFAEVYRVTHLRLNAPRALKVLRRDMPGVGSSDFQHCYDQFDFEAQLGARLDHGNVVKVHDFEQAGDDLCLVMEWASGGSLERRLREQGPLSVGEAIRLALDLCDGLTAIHEQLRAVHRDLKPSNVLFSADGAAKIGDLGLAQMPGGLSRRSLLGSQANYHPGTPAYMSPEQEREKGYLLPTSDLFSLGCVLFESLTGIPYKSVYGSRVSDHRQEAPAWLDGIVARALKEQAGRLPADDSDPAKRYRTAGGVRAEMEQGWQAEQAREAAAAKAPAEAEAAARRKREQEEKEAESRRQAEEAELARLFDLGPAALLRGEWPLASANLKDIVRRRPQGYDRGGRAAAALLAQADAGRARRRRTEVIAGLAAGALLVLIAVAVLLSLGCGGEPSPSSAATPMATPSASASPPPASLPHSLASISPANAARVAQLARLVKGQPYGAAWSNDGKYLGVASLVGVFLYAADTLAEVRFAETRVPVLSIVFSPDGKILASGSGGKTVTLWEVASGQELRTLAVYTGSIGRVAFSP